MSKYKTIAILACSLAGLVACADDGDDSRARSTSTTAAPADHSAHAAGDTDTTDATAVVDSTGVPATDAGEATATEEHAHEGCEWPTGTPLGGIPPQTPMFCEDLKEAPPTFVEADNSWSDDFDNGSKMQQLGGGYRAFEKLQGINQSGTFRHNDHWMVDVNASPQGASGGVGGSMIRPDRSFKFIDGKLVVEADVAAAIAGYEGVAWPEIVVSTADSPTAKEPFPDYAYAYGQFEGADTIGVRLQADRVPIAAMFEPGGTRTFELSYFQWEGATVYGGAAFEGRERAWRTCTNTDPDTECRDRFRWELTKDTVTLYVNGVKYMEHADLPPEKQLPDSLLNGDVYVYFASWTFDAPADVVRFHWDHLAVNP